MKNTTNKLFYMPPNHPENAQSIIEARAYMEFIDKHSLKRISTFSNFGIFSSLNNTVQPLKIEASNTMTATTPTAPSNNK